MFKEHLIVKNLGPLRDVTVTVLPVTVFLGDSGAGKSLLLKVLAMMRHICKKQVVRESLRLSAFKSKNFRLNRDSYLKFADIAHLWTATTKIEYELEWKNGCRYKVSCNSKISNLKVERLSANDDSRDTNDIVGPYMKIAFISDTRNLVSAWARKGANVQAKVLDNYFADTYALWDEAIESEELQQQGCTSLGLRVYVGRSEAGSRRIELVDQVTGRKNLFSQAASGQKAAIPILTIVRYLTQFFDFDQALQKGYLDALIADWLKRNLSLKDVVLPKGFSGNLLTLMIEEPELSLDPITQIAFTEEILREISCARNSKVGVVFTTHSPYWILALNVLVAESQKQRKMNNPALLNWDSVSGYQIKDGRAISLRNEEECLLMSPNLDDATLQLEERLNFSLL